VSQVIVYKLDENGRITYQYPAQVIAREPNNVRLEAFFSRDDMDLGYTTFKRGDRFIEYYYTDRWYNIFTIYDRDDGRLKGWYCNICRPARITETAVYCEDLALDIWVTPDGNTTILDQDEFAGLNLTPQEKTRSEQALNSLLALAQTGQLPDM
jgi:predicted RNA-binding protein associated with RNAse of E/G family